MPPSHTHQDELNDLGRHYTCALHTMARANHKIHGAGDSPSQQLHPQALAKQCEDAHAARAQWRLPAVAGFLQWIAGPCPCRAISTLTRVLHTMQDPTTRCDGWRPPAPQRVRAWHVLRLLPFSSCPRQSALKPASSPPWLPSPPLLPRQRLQLPPESRVRSKPYP